MRNLLVGGLIGAVAGGLVVYFLLWRPELERPIYRRSPQPSAGQLSGPPAGADLDRPPPPPRAVPGRAALPPPPPPPPGAPPAVTPAPRYREPILPPGQRAIAPAAPVALDPTEEPKASLRPEDIKDAIRGATPAVKGCYEQALKGSPELGGTLVVQFTVVKGSGTGRLRDAEILDDGLGNPFLGMCVLEALAEVEYPAPEGEGEVVVKYPFRMEPGPKEAGDEAATEDEE